METGSTFGGVGDLGNPRKVIAETIAGKLGVPAKGISQEEARNTSASWARSLAWTTRPRTNKTRQVLGWEPTHLGWVEDVHTGHYVA